MPRNLLRALLFGCIAFLLLLDTATAQEVSRYRADSTWFFKARIGLNGYGGDRDINPGDETQKQIENIGLSFGLEVGRSFTNRFSLSLFHLSGVYPRIEDVENDLGRPFPEPAYGNLDQNTTSKWRHHFTLLGRAHLLPTKRVSPYGQMGFNVSFGTINDELRTGFAPQAGLGTDFAINDRWGFFLELDGIFIFDDDALDLADTRAKETPDAPRNIDASDFDAFSFVGFGVRLNSKSAFVPVTVVCDSLLIPSTLIPGEAGTYAAKINPDATLPVEVSWDFGNGSVASGLGPHQKSFANPGPDERTYNVTVTATNGNGRHESRAVCPVTILAPPRCTIQAAPTSFDTCQQPLPAVNFTSSAQGTMPITYRWDFGDGATSDQSNPSHRYTRDDFEPTTITQTATLRVSNVAGSAMCTVDINIAQCPCNANLQLGTACFGRNDSVIADSLARQNLQDNLEILRDNPQTLIVVEGFAQPNERNAQSLADSRADAVAQFYIDNGIDPNRIVRIGLVQPEGDKTGPVCTQTIPFCDPADRDAHLQRQREQFPQQN